MPAFLYESICLSEKEGACQRDRETNIEIDRQIDRGKQKGRKGEINEETNREREIVRVRERETE